MNNNGWLPIKHNPPPEGEEIRVSDGKYIAQVEWRGGTYNGPSYISGYEWECYLDTPLYWKPLGELPIVNVEDIPDPVKFASFKEPELGTPEYDMFLCEERIIKHLRELPSPWISLIKSENWPADLMPINATTEEVK